MEISVKRLMELERILLEIDARVKFDLTLSEAFELYTHLRDVSRATNFVFNIQDEYNTRIGPTQEEMKKYHDKVMDSTLELDYERVTEFIDRICAKYENGTIREVIAKFRFW